MFHDHYDTYANFLRNDPSRNIVGENQEFLTSYAIKQAARIDVSDIIVHCVSVEKKTN